LVYDQRENLPAKFLKWSRQIQTPTLGRNCPVDGSKGTFMQATNKLSLRDFVDISSLFHKDQFQDDDAFRYLGKNLASWLNRFLDELGVKDEPVIKGNASPHAFISGRVYVEEGASVEPTALITGPCYVGPGAEIRHGAYIRGVAYIGKDAVVGHTTEVKGAIFFDGAKAGHFAYVGDSILGRNVNLGAGTKLANLKLKGDEVKVTHPRTGEKLGSGLRKFGAIMGDHSQTGCNAVLSPGTLLLPNTGVLPCVHFRGTLKDGLAK
jgi:UDP-N-acetylglucosamine diphosphorylase / glucose-1-phosphate thymidylyltransferase / UDP-N-acetylgalactosamine diphosphorylase / glucosamine-1-phosphate N-acetyltransferase / galactosamine-1-phosphate N-acetyltransferase